MLLALAAPFTFSCSCVVAEHLDVWQFFNLTRDFESGHDLPGCRRLVYVRFSNLKLGAVSAYHATRLPSVVVAADFALGPNGSPTS